MRKALLNYIKHIDLPLLVFLVLFLNVKFVVKLVVLAFVLIYSWNFKLGLSWKKSRLPLFYGGIILIELLKFIFITRNFSVNYSLVFGLGILQWAMSLMSIHYLKLSVEKNPSGRVHQTIKAFFAINFTVSVFFLLLLLLHPAWLSFWGHGTKLTFDHPSAGDAILGVSFDASSVNAAINCLGLIYFVFKKENLFSLICILVIVFCTSNIICFLTLGILLLMALSIRSKPLRLRSLAFAFLLIALYIPFSPKNREYMRDYFVNLYVLNKGRHALDTATYHLRSDDSFMFSEDSEFNSLDSLYSFDNKKLGKAMGNFAAFRHIRTDPRTGYIRIPDIIYQTKPGKLVSFVQTFYYLKHSFTHFLFGSGIGNFSSKLAFRASGVKTLGTYPKQYKYISPDFSHNHYFTFRYYYEASASKHSVINYPFSVYNQVLGEYGLIGALLFTFFYIGYFLSRYRKLSYGRYLIFALLGFFLTEYWFEVFSLVVIFELLMLQNIHEGIETRPKQDSDAAIDKVEA